MYSRKKTFEPLPEEMTAIWSCTQDDCNGWMRDNFSFSAEPTCPKCHSPMESGMRSLPVLVNLGMKSDQKNVKAGISIQD
ncbi:cold-shock protein [Cohnella candidum]|uniref:Cold-shock protein n=1 Tax=Cohnella candidum TaxID=2674991 RepID=A0A3G3K363_9BACL|nr:cold-shock protein [Cohnella candidum]AYQ74995.1 cold-shock protein [Cohnella candidum]